MDSFDYDLIMILLLVISLIINLSLVFLTINKKKKKKNKNLPFSYELGLLSFMIINIGIWTWDAIFYNFLVPLEVGFENFTYIEEILFQVILMGSLLIIIYTLEKIFWIKTKFIISIVVLGYLIAGTMIVILFRVTLTNLYYINIPIASILPISYLYLVIKGSSAIRVSSLYFFFGFGNLIVGGALRYQTVAIVAPQVIPGPWFIFISPIFFIIGGLVILIGFFKMRNYFYIPIKSIYIFMVNSGVCLFEYTFKKDENGDSQLITGGLSGIASLIGEITKTKTRLKEIRQENMNIIIEYGQEVGAAMLTGEKLGILHQKLKLLITEFERRYERNLRDWHSDISDFKSCIDLVYQIFEPSLIEDV